jgi:hypothetical protein
MQGQQRGAQERRREGGEGAKAKEVARTVGGKAAGAWVIGDRRMRWMEACYGRTDTMERSCAVAREKDINTKCPT